MHTLKLAIGYTFLTAFAVTVLAALLGSLKVVPFNDIALTGTFAFLIAQTIAVIMAIVKAPHYFEDPPAVKELKEKHSNHVEALINSRKESVLQVERNSEAAIAKIRVEHKNSIDAYRRKVTELENKVINLTSSNESLRAQIPKPILPIAAGSSRTRNS